MDAYGALKMFHAKISTFLLSYVLLKDALVGYLLQHARLMVPIRLWDLALQPASSKNSSCIDTEDVSTETTCLVSAGIFKHDAVAFGAPSPGFRSMAVSSDGKHLAAGDSRGNLHIFNLYTCDYTFIQDAHDTEIISLSFNLESWKNIVPMEDSESRAFLASGARDGTVHVFDVHRNFNLIGSIDCHLSAVTLQ